MKMNVMVIMVMFLAFSFVSGAESAGAAAAGKKNPQPVPVVTSGGGAHVDPFTGMEFVLVKGGCFQMGDVFDSGEANEKPVHEVCVSDYYMGKYEVTQAQWEKVMGKNPSSRKECGADCPVENVSWNAVQEFVAKINEKSKLIYRLPTEAEWEYAARSGGKKEKWAGVNEEPVIGNFAWFEKNSDSLIHKVGKKKPNGLGLHDMSGNAQEWCQDWYDENYYAASTKDNPAGPAAGQKRVLRGGDSGRMAQELRTTQRKADDAETSDGNYGFRLVRPAK